MSSKKIHGFPHHRLNADVPSRGIERIAYANADQRAEPLRLTILLLALVAMSTTAWMASTVDL